MKKEDEACESVDGVEIETTKKKAEASKTSSKKKKSKKVVNEVDESSRGRKKNEKLKTFKKKKKIKKNGVPEFEITIRKSYLKFLVIFKEIQQVFYTVSDM